LKFFPEDSELLFESIQKKYDNPLEALNSIESILDKNPEDENALSFKANLNQTLRKKNTMV
jgi:hypothetical protein